jgi:hypothetical protein
VDVDTGASLAMKPALRSTSSACRRAGSDAEGRPGKGNRQWAAIQDRQGLVDRRAAEQRSTPSSRAVRTDWSAAYG